MVLKLNIIRHHEELRQYAVRGLMAKLNISEEEAIAHLDSEPTSAEIADFTTHHQHKNYDPSDVVKMIPALRQARGIIYHRVWTAQQ